MDVVSCLPRALAGGSLIFFNPSPVEIRNRYFAGRADGLAVNDIFAKPIHRAAAKAKVSDAELLSEPRQ